MLLRKYNAYFLFHWRKVWEVMRVFLSRNNHQMLATEASNAGLASGALWLSVAFLCSASEHPKVSYRTLAEQSLCVRCSVMSATVVPEFSGCVHQTLRCVASDMPPRVSRPLWVASSVRLNVWWVLSEHLTYPLTVCRLTLWPLEINVRDSKPGHVLAIWASDIGCQRLTANRLHVRRPCFLWSERANGSICSRVSINSCWPAWALSLLAIFIDIATLWA